MSQNQCHFHTLSGLAEEVEENVAGKTISRFQNNKKKILLFLLAFSCF